MIKPKPKPTKRPKTKRTSSTTLRKRLKRQLEMAVKDIIFWRDGHQCVQHVQGGCGNGLMWGHYISQNSSAWLRYDLGNVFVQCGSHNMRDFHGDKSYAAWFASYFSPVCAMELDKVRAAHVNQERTVEELKALLEHYQMLYENRFYVDTDKKSLIAAGYYGATIQRWFK